MLVSLLVPHCSAFMNFFIHLCETRHVLMKMFGFCMRLLTTLDCSHKKVPYNMFVKTCKCFVRQYVAKYRHCYYSTSNKELLSYDPYQVGFRILLYTSLTFIDLSEYSTIMPIVIYSC